MCMSQLKIGLNKILFSFRGTVIDAVSVGVTSSQGRVQTFIIVVTDTPITRISSRTGTSETTRGI